MKKPLAVLLFIGILALFTTATKAQSFGTFASAVWLSNCSQSNFFNTSGTGGNLLGPAGNVFTNANLGVYTQNSGTLILRGGGVKTSRGASANVCSVRMLYRVYLQTGAPGAFTGIDLPLVSDCDVSAGQFPGGGGACSSASDQLWQRVIPDGTTVPYAPINLTGFAPGNYVLEVYYEVSGSNTSTTGCSDLVVLNNGGSNYKAFFSIQSPTFASNNPVTCNGSEGYITISGLVAGAVYSVSYTKNGVPIAIPLNLTANGSGQIVIPNLSAGLYSNFLLTINGCTTNLFIGIVLSNPIFIPTFAAIPPLCAGATPPVLPSASNNGIAGSWNPPAINNQNSGTYTFTPAGGTCGIPVIVDVSVVPQTTPTFGFGTSLTICGAGTVPSLPNTSANGITGSWNPAVVDNQNSGTYTFTPDAGQCATTTTFTVTVNPNITPSFSFGTSLTICPGGTVPILPGLSANGIAGTWSPAMIDDQNSATYTFTPSAGQCATPATFAVTVNPMITPTFSFGTSVTACGGNAVPTLPNTSTNGISGTWNPAVVDDQNSGTYTFTPTAGQCANPATLSVTINPVITPAFSFGASLSICKGGTVPALPGTSSNGITGVWSPAAVDNQNSDTYTFTPIAGQCAPTTTFTVTVNPIITPAFDFGTALTVCAGATVPALPAASTNGITGTWSPSAIDNQNSGSYTFTPATGQCANSTSLTVTVTPTTLPVFNIGTTFSICAGGAVPTLPGTSTNGIDGLWNPAVVDNQNSGTYTFTPNATPQQCILAATFAVTVNPILTPNFSFGNSLSICIGATVPALTDTSANGIAGTWSPAAIDNQNSDTYTFTPDSGQCAIPMTLTVEVNEIPTVIVRSDTSLYDGNIMPATSFTGTPANALFNWTNSQPGIGLPASGVGNIPSFTAVNMSDDPVIAAITVTPQLGGCLGTPHSYYITVIPLNKDVFVPNVFTPNGDGKNDKLYAYGNYIDKLEMRIFNQWGEQLALINNKSQGWDGTQRGKPQPVGVYVYVLKAVLSTGRIIQLKGSITLLR